MKPILETFEYVECDTLLLSLGLIPENELTEKIITDMNPLTRGPNVDDFFEAEIEGIFACGNVLHVHDLVDYVTQESTVAGEAAARYIQEGSRNKEDKYNLKTGDKVRYTIPLSVRKNFDKPQTIRFRVTEVSRDVYINVKLEDHTISRIKKRVIAPGEMESVILVPQQFKDLNGETITISIEGE